MHDGRSLNFLTQSNSKDCAYGMMMCVQLVQSETSQSLYEV